MTTRVLVASGDAAVVGLGVAAVAGQQLTIQSQGAAAKSLVVKAPASPTTDIFRVENSSAVGIFVIDQYGQMEGQYWNPIGATGPYIEP